MKEFFEMPDAGLLATRELRIPLQIAEQSSTSLTHFEQTSSLVRCRSLDTALAKIRLQKFEKLLYLKYKFKQRALGNMLKSIELKKKEDLKMLEVLYSMNMLEL